MNLQTLLESAREEFDRKTEEMNSKGGFLQDIGEEYEAIDFDVDAIKSFLTTFAHALLTAAREETKAERKNIHVDRTTDEKRYPHGFNAALTEVSSKWDLFLNEK